MKYEQIDHFPIAKVAIDTPHLNSLDYISVPGVGVGSLVSVPFGRQQLTGLVTSLEASSSYPPDKLKTIDSVCSALAPLSTDWLDLCQFAARYYLRSLGEVMLPSLPLSLRSAARWGKLATVINKHHEQENTPLPADNPTSLPLLTSSQQQVVERLNQAVGGGYAAFLLYGVTGSGKTEVYLRFMRALLEQNNHSQILLLVPEINLTPQLEAELKRRFPNQTLAVLHSGLAEGARTKAWLAAHLGQARIVLGTRLAILASLPHLAAIIVDEEHDPSYKQQEGLRYSARDLAVWRACQLSIPIVLGSATPSLESWWYSHASRHRYHRLVLPERAQTQAVLPDIKVINLDDERKLQRPLQSGISQPLLQAIKLRLSRCEQSLLYLNRRGYAPVINCDACGWLSHCHRCSAYLVFHREPDNKNILRCHYCGAEAQAPRHCPDCGNVDLTPLGHGTQRIEETLAALFPHANIARIDADTTRGKGGAQKLFDAVHHGTVDILIGTQMVAKGHDFQRITLVGILNADAALYSQDFRASERLFAQLMQVAGRAGRAGLRGEVLVQTRYPQADIYRALLQHDYPGYAEALLAQRQKAGLPPFAFQALLTVEARSQAACLVFLNAARASALALADCANGTVVLFDPVPCTVAKIANKERAQLLIESYSRPALQRTLSIWMECLASLRPRQKWQIERDPISI